MVSFVCNSCQETIKKPKLDAHAQRCHYASFSCIDCGVDFQGTSYRQHTTCMTEAEKYEGKLHKGKKQGSAHNKQKEKSTKKGSNNSPDSTVEQLTKKARELENSISRSDEASETKSSETSIANHEKRKNNDNKDSKKSKKNKKERSAKATTKEGDSWNNSSLPENLDDSITKALQYLLETSSSKEFADLKKTAIKMIKKHPQSNFSKDAIKDGFDAAVINALSENKIHLSL